MFFFQLARLISGDPPDIGDYCDRAIQCLVLKIDEARPKTLSFPVEHLSNRKRSERKKQLMETLEVGQVRRGIVKNIADFGAFVDLGGIDGLLHITDMSWGRIGHPSEMVSIDQEIEVQVLHIDRDREENCARHETANTKSMGKGRR